MDIRKIIGIILAVALTAVLFILIRSDRGTNTETQPMMTPVMMETNPPQDAPHYLVAVLPNSELEQYPLVRINLESMDIPVYACTNSEGEVCFFVYAYEEITGQYGFLSAYPSYPEVRIDNGAGFAEFPQLSKGTTTGESDYPELVLASINGKAEQLYYPADENGNMRDGAIPVVVEENNHIFGAYYVFDGEHKALIYPLEGPLTTPEPEETATSEASATVIPTDTPAAIVTPSATPRPTNRTPRPTAKPTATPSDTPTASPSATATATIQPSVTPTATPTETPTASPTAMPTETPTAAPTATPTASPTDMPTPSPTPGGHWEWHCHVCGKVFMDEASCMADQTYHKEHDGIAGYSKVWVEP